MSCQISDGLMNVMNQKNIHFIKMSVYIININVHIQRVRK